MNRSRLRDSRVKRTKKDLVLTLLVIVGLLFVLIKYGLPALINLSLLAEKNKDTSVTAKTNAQSYIAPPQLDQPFTATNTAEIKVSGTGISGETIKLYVNDALADSKDTDDKGAFNFSTVSLNSGNNSIKAIATKDGKESSPSNSIPITYLNKPPSLSIDSPAENDTIKGAKTISVKGKTDQNVKVTINGFWAIMHDDGSYSYQLDLQNGDNTISGIATDQAGNQTKVDRKVTYAP